MKSRAEYMRRRRARLIATGRCANCGGVPRVGVQLCQRCADRQAEAGRRYFQRLVRRG